jgi:hypothetical protein
MDIGIGGNPAASEYRGSMQIKSDAEHASLPSWHENAA